eukprot:3933575-Rhodomonas_salina.6
MPSSAERRRRRWRVKEGGADGVRAAGLRCGSARGGGKSAHLAGEINCESAHCPYILYQECGLLSLFSRCQRIFMAELVYSATKALVCGAEHVCGTEQAYAATSGDCEHPREVLR